MKHFAAPIALLAVFWAVSGCSHGQNESPALEGPYLGQKLPGLTPEAFAPGIVTTQGWEYGGSFTPDMNEFYFIREVEVEENKKQEFVVFQNKNKRWRETVLGV